MSELNAAFDARGAMPDDRFEGVRCLGAPADGDGLSRQRATPVRSLPEERVLWTRGEVLALRRPSGRRTRA